MSSKAMRVSARRDGREISSVTIARGCEPVLAGRSSKCAIRLPSDDHAASAVHAKIFWKGASLMIEDAGSRNGVFKDGLPLRRAVKMSPGSLYAVGGCVLSVADASAERSSKTVRRYHRLEFLNGDEAGRIVDIAPRDDGKDFDIGLDPKCSVNLRDLLVSRRHAVLKTNEAGECWIEDLASRNGTYVNGERLSSNERLLRDGDVISIAIFEFRFLDRRVVHTRAHMLFKLGVMMVTVCIVALGYVLWKGSRQPVQSYLAEARRQAAAGNFEAARPSSIRETPATTPTTAGRSTHSPRSSISGSPRTRHGFKSRRTCRKDASSLRGAVWTRSSPDRSSPGDGTPAECPRRRGRQTSRRRRSGSTSTEKTRLTRQRAMRRPTPTSASGPP